MDGIANVARQQQSQMSSSESQGRVREQMQQTQHIEQTRMQQSDIVKNMQTQASNEGKRINSKEQVQDLVDQLNKAMAPISTNLKFGVDGNDIFYVSVIEAQTNKMIRRFPAEKGIEFLPKMQEVSGMLFDSKG